MRVRPLDEAVRRYVLRSTEAFLAGAQNERWIVGVLSHSGLDRLTTVALIQPLFATSQFRNRAAFLQQWLRKE